MKIYEDAREIIDESIKRVLPGEAVKRALEERNFTGK